MTLAEVRKHLDDTYVTWAGGTGDDDAFYVRVHSPPRLDRGRLPGSGPPGGRVRRHPGQRRDAEARPLRRAHARRQRLRQGTPQAALPDVAAPPVRS
ncbi:DUF3500 domain-containing protein [Streptomyces sp. 3330]|uniref:DUF3500 domain-containing protein n=1 Tax=Streptomyces sp. 3330 TaxID=2817755 RepID=UPI00286A6EDC|nr:DUF3500 domain-containing protein [Streptomyces sp. 3330]